jgi:hypothetical protein
MSSVLRSYVLGGFLFISGVGAVSYLASYLGAKHVDEVVAAKLAAREPQEASAALLFDRLRRNDNPASLSDLQALAREGIPDASALLAWIYDDRAMVDERDALVMASLERMSDPDLLLFLGFVSRSFDPQARDEALDRILDGGKGVNRRRIYASMQTNLSSDDLGRLFSCYEKLQHLYSDAGASSRRAVRYAYFNDTMSCQSPKGLHDADQARS